MAEPGLAVSLHEFGISAAVVVGEGWSRLATPDQVSPAEARGALLARLGVEAQRQHRARIERLALNGVGPPGDAALLAAGAAAGFPDVELVPDPVAAVLDPASGPEFRAGEVVFVCDLGTGPAAAWRADLVHVAGDESAVLATRALPPGPLPPGLQPPGSPPPEPELAGRLPALAEVCAELAAATGVRPAGAVLTGAWAPHRGAVDKLQRALPGRLRAAAEPRLAVLRGLVRWLTGAGNRRVSAELPRWRVQPLSWRIPDRDARVVRWLVGEGAPFTTGTVLAQVRTCADRIYDLAAATDGVLLSHRVAAGARTGPALVAVAAPAVTAAAYHPPPHRHRWSTTGGWMLTSRRLVGWDGAGRYVHTRDLAGGGVAGELHPDHGGGKPQAARVFVDPGGRFCLLTWSLEGEFWVWDIAAGALRTRFTVSHPPGSRSGGTKPEAAGRVLVNEEQWRLAVEAKDAVSVGRYRRTAVTFWDLGSGARLDKLVSDDWGRRHPGYTGRSRADRFAIDVISPDGRLRAAIGEQGVSLYETATDRRVFRAAGGGAAAYHSAAFSADGQYLLAICETDDRSTVDVWQL